MNLALLLAYALTFLAVGTLVIAFAHLFLREIQKYERQYLDGASQSLDALYLEIPANRVLGYSLLCGLFGAALGLLMTLNVVFALPTALIGFCLPPCLLSSMRSRRRRRFEEQLPSLLYTLSGALRSGHSLPVAFDILRREAKNPASQEMGIVVQETRLGVSVEKALGNLARRMPGEDMELLATAIAVSERVGGNLTPVMGNLAHNVEEKHKLEGKVKALTAQGKMEGLIVGLLPFLLGIVLYGMNPNLMKPMFERPLGWVMLGVVVVLEFLGLILIRKIVTVPF